MADATEQVVDLSSDNNRYESGSSTSIIGNPPTGSFRLAASVLYTHNYFRKGVEKDTAICLKCEEENKESRETNASFVNKKEKFATKQGNTSGLSYHLKTQHQDLFKKYIEQQAKINDLKDKQQQEEEAARTKKRDGMKQSKLVIDGGSKLSVERNLDPNLQSRYDRAVVDFVANTFVSFNCMEKMPIILRALNPNGKVKVVTKDRRTISRHVHQYAEEIRDDIYSIVQFLKSNGTRNFPMTNDLWTNRNVETFFGLTMHVTAPDYQLEKFVPFVKFFTEKHTGQNLLLCLEKFYEALGLDGEDIEREQTMDNASNNRCMIRLSPDIQAIWCSCHTIALVVNDGFKETIDYICIREVVDKVHDLAVFVRRTKKRRDELQNACKEKGIQFFLPKKMAATRWNSKHDSMASVLKLRPAFNFIANDDVTGEWSEKVLSAYEYKIVEHVLMILKPFKKATKVWEADTVPTIHQVIPELFNIRDELVRHTKSSESYVRAFSESLLKSLDNRYPKLACDNTICAIAHFLDPYYRGEILRQFGGMYAKTKALIVERASISSQDDVLGDHAVLEDYNHNENAGDGSMSAAERLVKRRRMISDHPSLSTNLSPVQLELQMFEQCQVDDRSKDTLKWWATNEDRFELLSALARGIFAVQASSSSSERVFSFGSLICNPRRSSLAPDKIEDLLLIKLNKDRVDNFKRRFNVPSVKRTQKIVVDVELTDGVEVNSSSSEDESDVEIE